MNLNLSKKGLKIEPSITLDITAKAKAMKDSGIDVVSFGAGEPDFNTPKNIQEEGIRAIKEGLTRYTPASGIVELKKAICEKLKRDNNLDYETKNIIVSNGAKHSIYNALMAILNPEDEVIFSVPYWVSYPELVRLADGVPVYIETKEENNFKFTVKDLNKAMTEKTKAIILNSPNNPTGSVYSKKELTEIANWAVENNIFIVSDEIYEKLIYSEIGHIPIASINEEVKKLTILINGMSKAHAMTGWRIGYAAAHEDIIKIMSNIQAHSTSNPCSISQYASIEGLLGSQDSVYEMKKHFGQRRDRMAELINSIEGVSCKKPEGAFYIMMNFTKLKGKNIKGTIINSSLDFSNLLLEEAKVAVVPGIAFGDDDYVRLSYATSMENIEKGLKRIKEIVES
ncbi:MAG TPA: pyridoxal phosphate-dependent aminotransferase [Tissierellaceae bacterium]|nr:pyridoxal phosphate-dependent aminotransferase [Tissierellaceae bacterium]